MSLVVRCAYLAALLQLIFSGGMRDAHAQNAHALSPQERARALEIESQLHESAARGAPASGARVEGLEATPQGRDGKSVVTSVVPLGAPVPAEALKGPAETAEPRRAEISRFDYATGATIRTVVDLNSRAVLDERRDVNYPTPLAPEELAEAKSLLAASAKDVADIASAAGGIEKVQFLHLVPVAPHVSAPRYGHRLVLIWADRPSKSARYIVDLSTREVSKSR